jgi:hypothetical protein
MTNRTRFRSLDVVNNDPRVSQVFRDEDGFWLWLNPGWTCDPLSAHDGHENTVRDLLRVYRDIQPCACADCVTWAARLERQPGDTRNVRGYTQGKGAR